MSRLNLRRPSAVSGEVAAADDSAGWAAINISPSAFKSGLPTPIFSLGVGNLPARMATLYMEDQKGSRASPSLKLGIHLSSGVIQGCLHILLVEQNLLDRVRQIGVDAGILRPVVVRVTIRPGVEEH